MKRFFARIEERPVLSFIVVLVALFGTVALASHLRTPDEETALPEKAAKTSRLFIAGTDQSRLALSAQVKKAGVIDIVALAPGVVKNISVRSGQSVAAGQTLAILTNDYASGSADLAKQQARLSADFATQTFSLEKDILELEKDIAEDDDAKSKDEEKAALKELKLELERLRLGRENAALNLAIAERNDAVLRPKSMLSGTIGYIAVRPGDLVAPGTVLMTISGNSAATTLEATLPKKAALYLVDTGIAELTEGKSPVVLSQGTIAGSENALGLVTATYPLNRELSARFTQNSYVGLSLPLVSEASTGFLVPIDAIRLASSKTSVIVMQEDHTTIEKIVTLGETIGSSVIVESGLAKGDRIVLSPAVTAGEKIETLQ